MLPNLNSAAAAAWADPTHKRGGDEEQSPLQPLYSSASSSPSPTPSHAPHCFLPSSDPAGFNLSCFGLPLSAAHSRVGSPTLPDSKYSKSSAVKEEEGAGDMNGPMTTKKKKMKKGAPAKNLMAERRRRQKLNDKLLLLRSVVPNITKMDRVSILRDAIEYLEELKRNINRLENEVDPVESLTTSQSTSPATSSVTQATAAFTPTPPPNRETCPVSLPSPNGQPARIEVRANGRAMSIHMFCSKSPGVLLAVTTALDSVGIQIQKAVASSFHGFVLDIYCAQQCNEGGQYVHPEQIKALLLEAIGFTSA